MYRFRIIAVGKIKEKYYQDACDEYIKRLTPYAKVDITEISEYKCPGSPCAADINTVLSHEGRDIACAVPKNYALVSLCIEGVKTDSVGLSNKIEDFALRGYSGICFVIGGSFGLSDDIKRASDFRLSMSDMTFPHTFARVMLLEQLYRSVSILNNGKYHK